MSADDLLNFHTWRAWVVALVISGTLTGIWRLVIRFVVRRLARLVKMTDTNFDDFVTDLISKTNTLLLFGLSLGLSISVISVWRDVPPGAITFLRLLAVFAILIQVGLWGNALIPYLVERQIKQRMTLDPGSKTVVTAVSAVIKGLVWVLLFLMALDNIPGVNVSALVASLGIGGVAVALAVQNILGDLFSSLSIILDQPFVVGDFIVVGDFKGSVEKVGLKSTRVRSLTQEEIVFSNADLLDSRIRNYRTMERRRVSFTLGVVCEIAYEKLVAIPGLIEEIIAPMQDVTFERAHFRAYGESTLDFEVVYFIESPDFNLYMDIQQAVNLEIFKRFEEQGIGLAYPTRTIFLNRLLSPHQLSLEGEEQASSPQIETSEGVEAFPPNSG